MSIALPATSGDVTVEVLFPGKGFRGLANHVVQNRGPVQLAEFLQEAGLEGPGWRYTVLKPFKATGRTPRIQVRRYDTSGVHLWLRPGGNDGAIQGVLSNRDAGTFPPRRVYEVLHEHLERDQQPEVSPDPVDTTSEDADIVEIFLLSVVAASEKRPTTLDRFYDCLADEYPEENVGQDWLKSMVAALVRKGYLVLSKPVYALTDKGSSVIEGATVEAPPIPVVVPNAIPAPVPAPAKDPMPKSTKASPELQPLAALQKGQAKLKQLQELLPQILTARQKVDDLKMARAQLDAEIEAAGRSVVDLESRIDPALMAALIQE